MKKLHIYGLVMFLLVAACSKSVKTVTQADQQDESEFKDETVLLVDDALTLAHILERSPGVFVDYRGSTINVIVRGGQPLFVVDDIPIGTSYASVEHLVNVHDIAYVEVLKSPSEVTLYGFRGRHGVIHIHTRRY